MAFTPDLRKQLEKYHGKDMRNAERRGVRKACRNIVDQLKTTIHSVSRAMFKAQGLKVNAKTGRAVVGYAGTRRTKYVYHGHVVQPSQYIFQHEYGTKFQTGHGDVERVGRNTAPESQRLIISELQAQAEKFTT